MVWPYCSPSASASFSRVSGVPGASVGSAALRMVRWTAVMGNDTGLGLPERKEMIPGVCSRGRISRTSRVVRVSDRDEAKEGRETHWHLAFGFLPSR